MATNTQRQQARTTHQAPPDDNEFAGARLPTAIEELLTETTHGLSPRNQYDLLRNQIAPGCTDDELAHFLYVCKSRGLDPFAKQAYAIRRQSYDRDARAKVWKMTIQTAIDGFRLIAKRGGLEAQDEPIFEYSPEAVDDLLNPLGLVKCTVRVWKKGSDRPTTTSAYWDEYRQTADEYENNQKTGNKKLTGKWADMGRTMLAKVAEALTLRRAFPEELGSLYTPEEMDQAENEPRAPLPTTAAMAPPPQVEGAQLLADLTKAIAEAADDVALRRVGKQIVDAKIPDSARKALRGAYAHRKNSIAKAVREAAPPPPVDPDGTATRDPGEPPADWPGDVDQREPGAD